MRPGVILALTFALSLAGAAAWPSTQWAAEYKASLIAEEQCEKNWIDCREVVARPRKKKIDCEGAVASKTVTLVLSVFAKEPK